MMRRNIADDVVVGVKDGVRLLLSSSLLLSDDGDDAGDGKDDEGGICSFLGGIKICVIHEDEKCVPNFYNALKIDFISRRVRGNVYKTLK